MAASRRKFLGACTAGGLLAGLAEVPLLWKLPPVSAAETELPADIVQLAPDIEPLVRLIEDTPREELLEVVAVRVRDGLSYAELLAALQLAGVRNVEPRPSVGHKFHTVLVVNSCHLASQASPPEHRWLPLFWALDYFKSAQARDVQEGNWTMGPVDESAIPSAERAQAAFTDAMEEWDESAADVAAAGLVRAGDAGSVYELFAHYGCRDFRSIGHKAIYVSNSRRALDVIGWRHAEPIVRSLAYALLNHVGEPNPAESDLAADRAWRTNTELATQIPAGWLAGESDEGATRDLLAALRTDSPQAASALVVEQLQRGVAVQSVWDALLLGSAELLVRQPGIVSLHSVTTTNALRQAFEVVGNDDTRRMLLLQNAAFLPHFREAMHGRGEVGDFAIDQWQAEAGEKSAEVSEILETVSRDRRAAADEALAYLESGGPASDLVDASRLLLFFKGDDAHDYKFSSAVLEDYQRLSTPWKNRYLAASLLWLHGSGDRDNDLIRRAQSALSG